MNTEFKIFETSKEKRSLVFKDRVYRWKASFANGNNRWVCLKQQKEKCCGSVLVDESNKIIKTKEHSCVTNAAETEIFVRTSISKKRARDELSTSIANICKEEIVPLRNKGYNFVAGLQSHETATRTLRRIRQGAATIPTEAARAEDLVIPPDIKLKAHYHYLKSKNFCCTACCSSAGILRGGERLQICETLYPPRTNADKMSSNIEDQYEIKEEPHVHIIADGKIEEEYNNDSQVQIKEEPVECDIDSLQRPFESDHIIPELVEIKPDIETDIDPEKTVDKPDLIIIKEKQVECDVCHKRFLYRTQLRAHYYIHTGEKRFECDICHKRFTYRSAVKQHRYTHTGEKPYQCQHCKMSFNNATSLKCHNRLHTGITPYQCLICEKKFIDSTGLRHHRKVHEKKTTECDICHKSFPDSSIESHKLTHTLPSAPDKPDINRPFHCDICDKRFTLSNYLNKHKLIHLGQEPFTCHVCDKKFVFSNALTRHMLIHEQRNYECSVCDKRFTYALGLEVHMRTHTGEKPYKCEFCQRHFTQQGHYTEHRLIHIGEREQFECEVCHKKFTSLKYLQKQHMKLHAVQRVELVKVEMPTGSKL